MTTQRSPHKAHVARCQLGTALRLYLDQCDPVSVHVLACGGLEVAEGLARIAEATPFSAFALEVHPDLTDASLKTIRNSAWNAMKHARKRDGSSRDDEELLAGRWPDDNAALLMEGWFNLAQTGMPLPVEAQVFQLWMLAQHADGEQLDAAIANLFPDLSRMASSGRHAALLDVIEIARGDAEVMASDKTDPRPLILPI